MAYVSFKKAAIEALRQREPLSIDEIVDFAIDRKLIKPSGKTPWATMWANIYTDIKYFGDQSYLR